MTPSSRRSFLRTLVGGAAAVAVASCATDDNAPEPVVETTGPEPTPPSGPAPLPDALDRTNFVVHNEQPLALEARRSALGAGPITPVSRFFVRNNLPRPSESILANRMDWQVAIEGVVNPATLTLRQLQQFPWTTVTSVIQCSGNGRKFFEHGPSGSPWATGAAGCAMWTGVRVADVLASMGGAVPEGRFVTGTGGEPIPEGVERDTVVVERSIPLAKGLDDALLVWEMNGEPLPITHGGPVRLLVPGYFGCNQIKYIERLAVTEAETTAKIQSKGYRFRPIGESGGPDQPSLWRMPVKSWINGPGADGEPVLAGHVTVYGVALSGERGIRSVEVSQDGGATWIPATLGADMGPNAWRTFQLRLALEPGEHTLVSRAVDGQGEVQPELREDNERGYRHNGWRDHALTLTAMATVAPGTRPEPAAQAAPAPAAPSEPVTLSEAGERGRTVFTETASPPCGTCHTLADAGTQGVVGPNLNTLAPDAERVRAAVSEGVGAMPAFDGLSESQLADVVTYVVEATK